MKVSNEKVRRANQHTSEKEKVAVDRSCVTNEERSYFTHRYHMGTRKQEKERETKGEMETNGRERTKEGRIGVVG